MKILIVVLIVLMHTSVLHSDYHGHSHGFEAPHIKYSREANEKVIF